MTRVADTCTDLWRLQRGYDYVTEEIRKTKLSHLRREQLSLKDEAQIVIAHISNETSSWDEKQTHDSVI